MALWGLWGECWEGLGGYIVRLSWWSGNVILWVNTRSECSDGLIAVWPCEPIQGRVE